MIKLLLMAFAVLSCFSGSAQVSRPVFNHIAFYVQDLGKSTAFYRDIVGLDTIPEPFHDGKHTWFGVGPKSHLHLIAGAGAGEARDKNTHLCFSVPDVATFIVKLDRAGIPYEDWPGRKQQVTVRVDG